MKSPMEVELLVELLPGAGTFSLAKLYCHFEPPERGPFRGIRPDALVAVVQQAYYLIQ
jgi:hypothetical protein